MARLNYCVAAGLVAIAATVVAEENRTGAADAIRVPRIESFPREGRGYELIDWRQRAEDFVTFTLDPIRQGDYLPLMWWDDTRINWKGTTFGLPSYVGMKHQWGVFHSAHEGVVSMGVLISGALLGHDMTCYALPGGKAPVNLVRMQEAYFSPKDGIFLDGTAGQSGDSFWYEISPNILAGALVAAYPGEAGLADKWHTACTNWAAATIHLWHLNDFNFQSYDFRRQVAVVRHWCEPDSAAGLAFLLQMAGAKWPDEPLFRHATRCALDWLCAQDRNLNYEFFPAFGVYAAARCNAEQQTRYDVAKVLGWCFEDSAVRGIGPHTKDPAQGDGWGVVCGHWGDHDVAGLVGVSRGALSSPKMRGGYAFAMETFAYAWPLVAAVRYDKRLARPVGKWMHAAAHSARLFYPDQLPPQHQSDWAWASQHTTAIPYEGLMEKNNQTGEAGPFASGDPSNQGWGPINLGIYSGAFSGVFGAIVRPTTVKGVLALDVNKTDYFAGKTLPTTLLYNPQANEVKVKLATGPNPVRVWEAVANRWMTEGPVTNEVELTIRSDEAIVVTPVPAGLVTQIERGRLVVGGVVVDYSVPGDAGSRSR